jgi:hypothetical protein
MRLKREIIEFIRKITIIQFSKNMWLDLCVHALIGLFIGTCIILIRDINPMPALMLCTTASISIGLKNHLRIRKA